MPATQTPRWVNREAYEILMRAERELEPIIAEADKLESCGVDCQYYRDMAAALLAQARALRAAYFDPPPA